MDYDIFEGDVIPIVTHDVQNLRFRNYTDSLENYNNSVRTNMEYFRRGLGFDVVLPGSRMYNVLERNGVTTHALNYHHFTVPVSGEKPYEYYVPTYARPRQPIIYVPEKPQPSPPSVGSSSIKIAPIEPRFGYVTPATPTPMVLQDGRLNVKQGSPSFQGTTDQNFYFMNAMSWKDPSREIGYVNYGDNAGRQKITMKQVMEDPNTRMLIDSMGYGKQMNEAISFFRDNKPAGGQISDAKNYDIF